MVFTFCCNLLALSWKILLLSLCPFPLILFLLFPFLFPLSLSSLLFPPSLCVPSPFWGSLHRSSLGVWGKRRPTNGLWYILSWKSHYCISSDRHACIVICTGPVTYWYCFSEKKWQCGLEPTNEVPVMAYCPTSSRGRAWVYRIVAFGKVTSTHCCSCIDTSGTES